ncbi:transglutaminase-like cysteine peptidase [Bosea sp. 685]|uniref:transglutaminase-like cysteine peptidase n=1 Tax=Bosea sp. 685 TaxID=3080057 RepID=UPI002892DDE4|nr:transglutaminase-like cysteine peptidase [Bosea sp. 685]WNJ89844.1 transglutaminase-like cysteine peptidase [Bosea sp. 685]
MRLSVLRASLAAFALLLCGAQAAQAQWFFGLAVQIRTAHMQLGGSARAPAGFSAFCARSPGECRPVGARVGSVSLDGSRFGGLEAVNAEVNNGVQEVSDLVQYGREDYWSLPTSGKGDCEDFALMKRKLLIERGWPSSVLLITVVKMASGEGHAVLTVVTDQGDYVLDNRSSRIRLFGDTGYIFFSRQSQTSPRAWAVVELNTRLAMAGIVTTPSVTMSGASRVRVAPIAAASAAAAMPVGLSPER